MAAPGSKTPAPSNFIQTTSWGMSDTWVYDKLPNALEQAFGSYQMGTSPSLPQNFDTQNGMRTHSMRTPGQRQQNFVREAFLNEVASEAGIDPFQMRLKNTSATRLANVVAEVIKASGWQTRPSPSKGASTTSSTAIAGQGCSVMLRSDAYWTCVAMVEVTPKTGKVSVTKLTTVVDPGIVINPRQLTRMAQGGAIMGTSEALHEEVHFNTGGITDHDWVSFPILRMIEAPEVDVIIINNPSVGVYGSGGEGPNGFVQAAIASAVFDATGKMPRRIPFTPGYIRALMAS
jgi:CO/xanthine dehydrogenase Mo-binding subunit